ncbi:MAG: glycoside hydrolase family 28 protein [Polyangiaceae bacterium]
MMPTRLSWSSWASLVLLVAACGGSSASDTGSDGDGGGAQPSGTSSSGTSGSSGGGQTGTGSSGEDGSVGSATDASLGASTSSGGGGGDASGSSGSASSGSSGSSSGTEGGSAGPDACGAGDPVLAAAGVSEPSLPSSVCRTIQATKSVSAGGSPSGSTDTSAIQAALDACGGAAVKLVANGAHNALLTGPLTIKSTILWVDAGVTLYAATGATSTILTVTGTGAGIVGDGTIDGQGSGYWSKPPGPTLIEATGSKFVMYRITLHDAPGFHVKVTGDHFVIWGTTLQTPSTGTGGQTPATAHNTDGIDPGAGAHAATSYGYIVCNTISVGDDMIAIKGGTNGPVSHLTIAHNHFGAGHGMSIGSETGPGGVSDVNVYDLTIDGSVFPGASAANANGIRIKSYQGAGGLVDRITYQDICTRNLANPILLEPNYTAGTVTGGGTPQFTNIDVRDFHDLSTTSVKPVVTLDGYDSSHESTVTLDNVVVDGNPTVTSSNATITFGSGGANFTVPGATSSGTPSPIDCSNRWVTFPVTF